MVNDTRFVLGATLTGPKTETDVERIHDLRITVDRTLLCKSCVDKPKENTTDDKKIYIDLTGISNLDPDSSEVNNYLTYPCPLNKGLQISKLASAPQDLKN